MGQLIKFFCDCRDDDGNILYQCDNREVCPLLKLPIRTYKRDKETKTKEDKE